MDFPFSVNIDPSVAEQAKKIAHKLYALHEKMQEMYEASEKVRMELWEKLYEDSVLDGDKFNYTYNGETDEITCLGYADDSDFNFDVNAMLEGLTEDQTPHKLND